MNIRCLFYGLCCSFMLGTTYTPLVVAMTPPGMPFQITEEDLKKAEAEIEAFRASLSAEERAKFDNDVAELTRALENMSEKELEDFFTQLATMDQEMAAQMPAPAAPAPMPTPAPEPEKEPAKPTPTKKIDTKPAEELIDAIIRRINSFLIKIKAIPEFDRKIVVWQQEGKLKQETEALEWFDLENGIELFKQKLASLKNKDPKTNEFRYLNDLIEDKKLYEKLSELNSALNNNEPNIIVGETPGTQIISKNSKKFIRNVIDLLTTTVVKEKIVADIDAIIEKYEPIAKKIREQEEKKEQKALEASRRSAQPEPVKSFGKAPAERIAQATTPDFGGGFAGGGYNPTPSYTPASSISGFGETVPTAQPPLQTESSAGGVSAPLIPKEAPKTTEKTEKGGDIKIEKPQAETANLATDEKEKPKESDLRAIITLERLAQKANNTIKNIIIPYLDNPHIKEIKKTVNNATVDYEAAKKMYKFGVELAELKEKLKLIETGLKKVSEKDQGAISADFKPVFEDYGKKIEKLFNDLKEIEGNASAIKQKSNDHAYAFFADKSVKPTPAADAVLKGKPADLIKIKKDLEDIFNMLQKISK